MATERAHHGDADRGYAIRRIEGASYPLPPRTDEELAAMRAAHPEQAWFWTRAFYDGERKAEAEAEARRAAGEHNPVQYSAKELFAFLDSHSATNAADNAGSEYGSGTIQ